jgi:hypothetical protein
LEFEGKEKKVKAYMIVILWTSVRDHVKTMTAKEVMVCLPLISAAAEHVEMHHAQFRIE